MSKRFLIVVGLPKSGTTFLYSECTKRPDVFGMPIGNKEVDYFRRGSDFDTYLSLFDQGEDKVIFDASPLYLDQIELSVANILTATEGHEVKIVVCLRDPLERAYSHYLHDVATNQKIIGHADYSFWSPTVLAKYLFSMEPRIKYLQEAFGVNNVLPFAFGHDMAPFESALRDFVGLGEDWSLNLSSNPAPGFTSPQTFFNKDFDSEVQLGQGRYLLPKGCLLVVNREYSLFRKNLQASLATEITARQSSLTRNCDTGVLSEETRERVFADMEAAAALMGLKLKFDRAPREMRSKLSNQLPANILSKLKFLGDCDDSVFKAMETGIQPTIRAISNLDDDVPSLARSMACMQLANAKDPSISQTTQQIRTSIIETFGPIPFFIEGQMHWHVARGQYDEALAIFEPFGGANRLLWPMDLARFLIAQKIELPDDVAKRFEDAGVRVRLPN